MKKCSQGVEKDLQFQEEKCTSFHTCICAYVNLRIPTEYAYTHVMHICVCIRAYMGGTATPTIGISSGGYICQGLWNQNPNWCPRMFPTLGSPTIDLKFCSIHCALCLEAFVNPGPRAINKDNTCLHMRVHICNYVYACVYKKSKPRPEFGLTWLQGAGLLLGNAAHPPAAS